MIRKGQAADGPEFIGILAEAFADDPVFNWISTHPEYGRFSFANLFQALICQDECYLDDLGRGAALWVPPGMVMNSPITLNSVVNALGFGLRANWRSIRALRSVARLHPQHPPHYYLFAIGTRLNARGCGVGAALMQEVLQRCDRQGIPAYLENSRETNLGFYRSQGFELRQTFRIAGNGPPMWAMWREPRQAA